MLLVNEAREKAASFHCDFRSTCNRSGIRKDMGHLGYFRSQMSLTKSAAPHISWF